MHARVTRATGKREDIDRVVASFRDAPSQTQQGWKGGYVLVDRDTGKLISVTLWESKESMDRSASWARQVWTEALSMAGAGQPDIENYEVELQPRPAERRSEAGPAAHTRVTTIMGRPESIDRTVDVFRKAMKGEEKGWRGAYVLVNRQTGEILTFTLWESRQHIEDTASMAKQVRGEAISAAGAGEPTVEHYEVALQPEPAEISSMAR